MYLVPAFFVYGPVFSIDDDRQLVGVVIQTFLIESLMRDILIGFDNQQTIQFLVIQILFVILFCFVIILFIAVE